MTMHTAYVGLGSNQNDPIKQLSNAFSDLDNLAGTRLITRSSLFRSTPIGYLEQPDFVNAVARIATVLSPPELLKALLNIEHQYGRERAFRNAPRTLDLDVLLFDDMQLHESGLIIPHPRMHLRAFVLRPLLEIAPEVSIPGVGRAQALLAQCHEQKVESVVCVV